MQVSNCFNLDKSQAELDFVDVDIHTDNPLFIDPFAISQRPDPWSQDAHQMVIDFFQRVVDLLPLQLAQLMHRKRLMMHLVRRIYLASS
jgi:hypothetical protein